ncbi:iron complex transport system permease protein [Glutamicibacter mysorens]|uniref:Iron complex transport system permease protein n=1 Tax=Glutamicibacter mysorens TaxID=257984 RepID=A0ABX4N286_9MICC|nr:iron ABC transporter permease [Glutamicibacter mysorens]PJJ45753.1 iron complex transport system permease protein [Glutamicibacter mysorens]
MLQERGARRRPRVSPWLAASAVLMLLGLLSCALGTKNISLAESWAALASFDAGNNDHLLVRELRVPRTLLAVVVGAGLGLAGALMQSMTRNPLAEPGLLGVNAGAAFAVAIAITLGVVQPAGYMSFAFAGAAAASVIVYLMGSRRQSGNDVVRLVLAGAGLSVMLMAVTQILVIGGGTETHERFAAWTTGSLQGRGYDVLPIAALVVITGAMIALGLSRSLDALALGEDSARALGVSPARAWLLSSIAVMLLAGAATAAAGPISFVGLAAPHAARMLVGAQHLRSLPLSMLLGAGVLLIADISGRLVAAPMEIGAGAMSALIGAPVFIYLARRRLKAGK